MLAAKQICQVAWVVNDLDAAIRHWQQTAGIGPFYVGEHVGGIFTEATHRGSPVEVDMSCAIAQSGPIQIELIKQHGGASSPYRDVYAEGESGLHHLCSFVDDVEAECRNYEGHGFEVVMRGVVAGQTPVAYVDTRAMTGCMTELMGRSGLVVDIFAAAAASAADWDGTDPIRDLATLMS
ncbi:hypothetical protein A5685_08270 [Mycobacterium colombiense]|uniref:VOC domain-containing protein n=1 Tax=Mycobacterium colombiense TaxID=339268 RepID=A0A1A2RWY0_9MYCO|nr:VOC family protein [Mycobacterium colombiense]OBH56374.1 hypothetical protein A5685_08270 [Mycobacterium colombiense]